MDAFFYVDKPQWITSFDVLRQMRRTLGVKKLWHTGTLDPLATGGLLVATWNYTKLISYIDKETKSYEATIMLNGVSDSYDSDTAVDFISETEQESFSKNISLTRVERIFAENFIWKISQIPPSYSALKINGKRALERVRNGEEVTMKSRKTEIFLYKILEYDYPKLRVSLTVQAGTYIRSIAHDLGQIIWCGWYISQLRRTWVGSLWMWDMMKLENLSPENTLDIRKVFPEDIFILQDDIIYRRLSDGQRVRYEIELPEWRDILLSDEEMAIRYVVEYRDGVLHPRKKII